MATRKAQNRETFDVVQWDGLKETALAFFGMDVLDDVNEDPYRYYFDGDLWAGDQIVPFNWYLVKDQSGHVIDMCPDRFNDEYEIIDEYPA